jgi:hypothetical protein
MIGGRSWLDRLKELAFLPHAFASQSSEGAENCMLSSCQSFGSALIVDLILWHSSSFSLAMNELCLPCARLLCLSSSLV